ncbi:hypothetical protein 10P302A_gene0001 [Pseudomonas phage 10P302A]|uniref:Uncharacterized protein n=1 Tax=Pseudomonas phage 10P302A TaxID=3038233 RepID=A0AAF0GJ42_9CAUD|nr:hypothetical protein 10P302A_gene0001 [Pseudomonas phage 10P302A]
MSVRTKQLQAELDDLDERIKLAINAHEAAKSAFGRLEVSPAHFMWGKLRDEIDRTLIHQRVLQAHWHRTKAALLEALNADKE